GEAPGLVEEVLQPGLSGGGLVLWHADLRCASTLVRSRRPRATRGRRDGSTVRRGERPHDQGPRPGECRPVPVRVVTRVRSSEGSLAKRAAGATREGRRGPRGGRQARARRCLTASYSTTVVALAALSELAEPSIGMLTMTSHASRQPALSPVVSLPVRTSVGPV